MKQANQNNRMCPICNGDNKDLLFSQRFIEISEASILAGYNVVVCVNCGFCFADHIPDQTAFDHYYREMSKYEHQDHAGQPSEFEARQFPALAHYIQQYIPGPKARILEIGCANGGLLNALKQSGYSNILGVDPSPVCARNAEQLYQIRVLTNSISDLDIGIGKFDFIILVAVLEHIKDLDATLMKIRELMSMEGRLFIEVPDATQFATSPDAPFQEFSIEHINFFSPVSLKNLLVSYGFSQVSYSHVSYDQTDTHTGYALRMVFQKDAEIMRSGIEKDFQTKSALEHYINVSRSKEERIHETVNELVDSQKPLIVWGVGTHTQRLLATSRLALANIHAFVDSNANYHGKDLNGIPIISPQALQTKSEAILISSCVFQQEIEHQIRYELRLDNPVITLYMMDKGRSL